MASSGRSLGGRDRLLIVRLGAVGDVLRTLPALHVIRANFPGVHVVWIVEDLSYELLAGHPEIDEVIRVERSSLRAAAGRPLRLPGLVADVRRELRSRRFTVAMDFQGSFKSGALAFLSGAVRRIGFGPGHCRELSFLFTNEWVRPYRPDLNRVERNLILAEAVGARGETIEVILPESPVESRAAEQMLRELNTRGGPIVVLSPGASRRQWHKRWPDESFARLADLLSRSLGVRPLVAWGPGEESLARSVVAGSAGGALLMPATTLRSLAAVLRRSALFVGADTGPMHLAWGVGCPVLALFGPTDPRLNAPLGRTHVVLRAGGATADITPQEAFEAARRILQAPAPAIAPHLLRSDLFPRPGEPRR